MSDFITDRNSSTIKSERLGRDVEIAELVSKKATGVKQLEFCPQGDIGHMVKKKQCLKDLIGVKW